MDRDELASRIDHTLLNKDERDRRYSDHIQEAEEVGANVCVPPAHLEKTDSFSGEVSAVISFPHGTSTTKVKQYASKDAVERGATEVDFVTNVSYLKSGMHEEFIRDVSGVAEVDATTKAIIETGLLTDEEKVTASRLCAEAGADYIKTCTGYSEGNATVRDVRIIKKEVGDRAMVKASGGVGSPEEAIELIQAGASRIGASSGAEIVRGYSP